MIKRLIKNLRQKPKSTRDAVALGLASVFTAMVTLVWFYNSPAKMPALGEMVVKEEKPAFSGFFSGFKDQLASVGQSVESVKEASTTNVLPEEENQDWRNSFANSSTTLMSSSPLDNMFATSSGSSTTGISSYGFASTTYEQAPAAVIEEKEEAPRSIRIVTTKTATSGTTTLTH
ncbi:MAG: hypothetical protein KBC35_01000 [Candidatus Pacebacteria bacterium]|nr:hypothetical protein [Candidatus Paceibacterota bacterium]